MLKTQEEIPVEDSSGRGSTGIAAAQKYDAAQIDKLEGLEAVRNRSIDVDGDFYFCAKAGEMFIDRIIQDLENQMVQTSLIRIADEHSRPFSNRLEAL